MFYTVDQNSDEPIMLINKHIGFDSIDGMGVDGAAFQSELLYLDTLGKKRIQVWVNSPGGVVLDGYNIFNAILKSKTPVDTYCCGVAASIAGVIFMAGRKRVMADYARLMIHPPMGVESDRKALDAFQGSLITMLSAKSNISETDVKYLMDRTTWLTPWECLEKGFCTEIEATSESNRKRMQTNDVKAMLMVGQEITNSILNTNSSQKSSNNKVMMTKITMKLGLNDAATEDSIVSAIKAIEDRAYNSELKTISAEKSLEDFQNASKKDKEEMKKMLDKIKAELDEKTQEYTVCKAKLDAMEEDKIKAENKAKEIEAKNMIESFAKTGRIKNEASTILKWTNLAIADFEGTKSLIEEIPLNKTAPVQTELIGNKLSVGEMPTTAISLALKNKLKSEGKIPR